MDECAGRTCLTRAAHWQGDRKPWPVRALPRQGLVNAGPSVLERSWVLLGPRRNGRFPVHSPPPHATRNGISSTADRPIFKLCGTVCAPCHSVPCALVAGRAQDEPRERQGSYKRRNDTLLARTWRQASAALCNCRREEDTRRTGRMRGRCCCVGSMCNACGADETEAASEG